MIPELEQLGLDPNELGLVIVDHGSRRQESNLLLVEIATMFQRISNLPIVEPAHMELAEPSIAQAFDRCVERGAKMVVVFPYFLAPGRHWNQDIPALSASASERHPGVKYLVSSPLGLDDLMGQIIMKRVTGCLEHALQDGPVCNVCAETSGCQLRSC